MYSPDFIELLTCSVGKDAAEKALEAFSAPPSVSIRLNPAKPSAPFGDDIDTVPWSPYGRFLPQRPSFTLDPLFHAGAYYVQDSSAMAVGAVFREFASGYRQSPVLKVLDLCAAPGGKTTDLASSLREISGGKFLLVANEVVRQRASALKENVAKWGDPNVVVTSADPSVFSSLKGFFDIIVADVPCSGEGMFRKEPDAVRDWSLETVNLCASRQRRILADVWDALRPGGLLIYSTCTFNHFENAGNVRWIASELGAKILSPKAYEGMVSTPEGLALIPGLVRGEGQEVSALEKTSAAKASLPAVGERVEPRKSLPGRPNSSLPAPTGNLSALLTSPAVITPHGDTLVAVPIDIKNEVQALERLHPLSRGVSLGSVKGSTLVPSADLALSSALAPDAFPRFELSLEEALKFLRRDSILTPGAPKGYVLVCYKGIPLGFVKNLGNRTNNLHPTSRRILQRQ